MKFEKLSKSNSSVQPSPTFASEGGCRSDVDQIQDHCHLSLCQNLNLGSSFSPNHAILSLSMWPTSLPIQIARPTSVCSAMVDL